MNRNQQKLFVHAVLPMIACFFGYTGHVTTVALEDRRTVNTDWYTICLPEVINCVEQTEIVASSFIMTTPAVTHHVKPLIFYPVIMLN